MAGGNFRLARSLAFCRLLSTKHAASIACSRAECDFDRVLLAGPWLNFCAAALAARVLDATGASVGCAMGTLGADCTDVFGTALGTACVGGVDATLGTAGRIVGAGSGALGVLCALDDFEASIVAASPIALIFLNGATSLSGD